MAKPPRAKPRKKPGRPSLLDDTTDLRRRRKRFLELLRQGVSVRTAAGASQLGRSTVARVLAQGRREKRGRYRAFWDQVQAAQDEGIAKLHETVVTATTTTPALALQLLRAIRPAEYNPDLMVKLLALETGDDDTPSGRRGVTVRRERVVPNESGPDGGGA